MREMPNTRFRAVEHASDRMNSCLALFDSHIFHIARRSKGKRILYYNNINFTDAYYYWLDASPRFQHDDIDVNVRFAIIYYSC